VKVFAVLEDLQACWKILHCFSPVRSHPWPSGVIDFHSWYWYAQWISHRWNSQVCNKTMNVLCFAQLFFTYVKVIQITTFMIQLQI